VPDVAVNAIPQKDGAHAVYVAPAWKLTWWRFRKHKLAVVSLWVVVLISAIAAMPEFFAVQDPYATSARRAFIPPQPIQILHEGRLVRRSPTASSASATHARSGCSGSSTKRCATRSGSSPAGTSTDSSASSAPTGT
jgi:hypothetical protein